MNEFDTLDLRPMMILFIKKGGKGFSFFLSFFVRVLLFEIENNNNRKSMNQKKSNKKDILFKKFF